jgi:hypothetical protein
MFAYSRMWPNPVRTRSVRFPKPVFDRVWPALAGFDRVKIKDHIATLRQDSPATSLLAVVLV